MDQLMIYKLKEAFHEQISSLQPYSSTPSKSTLSLLTAEELKELEQIWIDFTMWKKTQKS
ncbi:MULTISPECIES: hypothetical protein [Vibrio]|uniref:3-demethylubiquinone-9 3-methyltransferase n=1 Tax=Vibrio diazotrophicus TaxID=685 RepID=A0A2J8HEF1_VIBDI|nr:hypothetical protein [Vibrio diazotrophicus]MCF7360554.1 hypothetical protein [Vibrio sp. A1-b2]MCZ4371212.1 hypothetical protein [Vibrio diazotrophicus]PNH82544.1 hypothetical protein C1N27_03500 [Vibrio diazotrophicus]PNH95002.1 hypothetical protein C1M59_02900 [Vibrio diazotrophicus]PNH96637.1 hypothetical protein C1O24_09910 [Vibrio diazotrophicus]